MYLKWMFLKQFLLCCSHDVYRFYKIYFWNETDVPEFTLILFLHPVSFYCSSLQKIFLNASKIIPIPQKLEKNSVSTVCNCLSTSYSKSLDLLKIPSNISLYSFNKPYKISMCWSFWYFNLHVKKIIGNNYFHLVVVMICSLKTHI